MNYLMRIANPYITQCRIANPTQRPDFRTSPRTDGTPRPQNIPEDGK